MGQKQNSRAKDRQKRPAQDPKNPASKPNATTEDQVANMESEGQAQQPGQDPPAEDSDLAERKRQAEGNRGPTEIPGFGQGA
jgi:hypothetical protein